MKHDVLKKKMDLRYYKDPEGGYSNSPITPHSEVSLGYDWLITIESLGVKHKYKLTHKSGMLSVSEVIAVLCKNTDLKVLVTAEDKAKFRRAWERKFGKRRKLKK